eukprot:g25197.t1
MQVSSRRAVITITPTNSAGFSSGESGTGTYLIDFSDPLADECYDPPPDWSTESRSDADPHSGAEGRDRMSSRAVPHKRRL